jgi:hypothetical protein
MRPIKFRGRNYVSDEWLYGSLIQIKHPNKVYAIESMEGVARMPKRFLLTKTKKI